MLNEHKSVVDLEKTLIGAGEKLTPYEALKGLTRTNEKITQKSMADFIESLEVSETIKKELKAITPSNYTGI